mmetsp:Transcript_3550/g.8487  ORF Transcript_3550/g.8487 Transcript_3550/m.8487 type:complete len:150 (-) Transcript_3550:3778-4227(-)
MSRFLNRIEKEKNQVRINGIDGVIMKDSKLNPRHVILIIGFPFSSKFGYRSHVVEIFLSPGYPLQSPKVIFRGKLFHPNVDFFGRPCLDILKDQWSPAFQIRTVILSLQAFAQNFSFIDPLNQTIKKLFERKNMFILKFCRLLELICLF